MTMHLPTTLTPAAVIVLSAGVALADDHGVTIADLAPSGTGVLVSTNDFADARAAFERTDLAAWWNHPEVQEWLTERFTELIDEANDSFESLELELEDFVPPEGAAGLALWPEPASADDEGALHVLAAADFGEDGVETMFETLQEVLAEGEDAGEISIDETDFGDTIIYTVVPVEDEDGGDDEMDDFMAEWEDFEEDEPFEELHFAKTGTFIVASSSLEDLENALVRLEGEDIESFAQTRAFGEATGEYDDAHVHAVLVNEPFYAAQRALDDLAADDEMGFGPPMPPVMDLLGALGLASVQWASAGVSIDTDAGLAEAPFIVRTPEKEGVLALVDMDDRAFTPPAFVTADVASVTMLQADVANLIPTIQTAANQLDPEAAAMINQQIGFVSAFVGPILQHLGPEVYLIQTIDRPFAADSQQIVVAIGTPNSEALTAAIAGPAEQFLQMTPEDFQGNQLFRGNDDFGTPSIGITSNFVFLGDGPSVENALRQAANPGGATLANEQRFTDAMADMPAEGLSFSWTNMSISLDYTRWMFENQGEIVRREIETWAPDAGYTEEEIDQLVAESTTEDPFDVPQVDLLVEALGDTVTEVRTTADGFRGNQVLLRAD